MGFADATGALAELADLEQLDDLLGQDYPGASLDDIDEELIEQALGRQAVDDMAQLRRDRARAAPAGLRASTGGDGLTADTAGAATARRDRAAPGLRRAGVARPRQPRRPRRGRGRRDHRRQPRVALRRRAAAGRRPHGAQRRAAHGGARSLRLDLAAEDFEVVETERRSSAAVALLVDMSYSMELRGTWGEAKTTALALHALVTTKYPQDAIEIIGFSDYARVMSTGALVEHDWDRVQGTNLQHGLMLARRHLDKHRDAEPVILVITDGEPTAHLAAGRLRRLRLAADAADDRRHPRRGRALHPPRRDDQRLHARRRPAPGRLHAGGRPPQRRAGVSAEAGGAGQFVVADYLRSRRGHRQRKAG